MLVDPDLPSQVLPGVGRNPREQQNSDQVSSSRVTCAKLGAGCGAPDTVVARRVVHSS